MRFLDEEIPYLDMSGSPFHEDPLKPIIGSGNKNGAERQEPSEIPIRWWHRDDRYAERLAPGTKFADIIGEIDPAKLAGGSQHVDRRRIAFRLDPADASRNFCDQ